MQNTNIRMSLCFYGDSFDIDAFTDLVGVNPTKSWVKGEENNNHSNAPRRHETNWEYSTEVIISYDLYNAYNIVLDLFGDKVEEIRKFVNDNNLNVKIDIIPIIENNICPSLYFERKFLKFIFDIGAEIDIDMYIN